MRSYQKTICALAAAAMLAPLPALAEEGGLILPGFSTGAAVQSYLRLFNSDGAPHSPVVMLHSAATGEMLGAWTGPSIPTGGTYEASLAVMIAGSDPPITPERLPRSLVLRVSGLSGHVQHAARADASGAWSNVTTCGMAMMEDPLSLPYVSGPARQDLTGFVRITNGTSQPRSSRVFFNDNAGVVSTWDSPVVSATGAVVVSMADIVLRPVPAIAPTARSGMIMADMAPYGISLSYMEGLRGSGTFDDFSAACMVAIPAAAPPIPVEPGGGIGGMPGMPGHPE